MAERLVEARPTFRRLAFVALVGIVAVSMATTGCNSGGRDGAGSNIPNISQAAEPLPFDGTAYTGPQMNIARYGHTATPLEDGTVLVTGGSDERFLTSLDVAEIFDQTIFDQPIPESISGAFIDTDFEGDPMAMENGGRVFHSATLLPQGSVLIAGGSRDILIAEATPVAELFDTVTRQFSPDDLEIANEMRFPRFRHSATLMSNGQVLLVGGQLSVMETIIDTNFPPGHPLFMIDVQTFPSTPSMEFFNPTSREFEDAFDLAGGFSELVTPRGRTDHGSGLVAGEDNVLGTSDDILIHAGGYQTLSSIFAPFTKYPNQVDLDEQTGVEYYELTTGVNTTAPAIAVVGRANTPQMNNLGIFRQTTIDGLPGVTNLMLISNGDDNELCRSTIGSSELLATSYTGLGPGNGINFAYIVTATQSQGFEGGSPPGRSNAPTLMLPVQRVYDGVAQGSNWIFTMGGGFLFCPMGVQVEDPFAAEVVAHYDPFYNPLARPLGGEDGSMLEHYMYIPGDPTTFTIPWDHSVNRGLLTGPNGVELLPSGIIGCWLITDGLPTSDPSPPGFHVPDDSLINFRDFDLVDDDGDGILELVTGRPLDPGLSLIRNRRGFHTLTQLPGEDGIPNTFDDRILLAGGGTAVTIEGEEPVSVSSEVYLPVGANSSQ